MTKKIVFTGGGSAGHVSVNAAIIPEFLKHDWDVTYIGSKKALKKISSKRNFPRSVMKRFPLGNSGVTYLLKI